MRHFQMVGSSVLPLCRTYTLVQIQLLFVIFCSFFAAFDVAKERVGFAKLA